MLGEINTNGITVADALRLRITVHHQSVAGLPVPHQKELVGMAPTQPGDDFPLDPAQTSRVNEPAPTVDFLGIEADDVLPLATGTRELPEGGAEILDLPSRSIEVVNDQHVARAAPTTLAVSLALAKH